MGGKMFFFFICFHIKKELMTSNNDEVPQTMILQGKQSMKKKTDQICKALEIFQANENDLHRQQRSRFSSCAGPVKTQTSKTIYFLPSAA